MTEMVFKLNGKDFRGSCNSAGELNSSVKGLEDSVIIGLPSKASESGSCVYRQIDDNKWIKIGTHFMTKSEKDSYYASKSVGKSSGSKVDQSIAKELYDYLKASGDSKALELFMKLNVYKDEKQKAVDKLKALGLTLEDLADLF